MDNLKSILSEKSKIITDSKPKIFDLKNSSEENIVKELFSQNKIIQVVDDYLEQQKELFAVKNPNLVFSPNLQSEFEKYLESIQKESSLLYHGRWVFYPWLSTLVHILEETDYRLVRTTRNQNLINKEEQEKFYNAVVGIGGLSVGNSIALSIVLQGGAKHIRLADFDRLALSNTNRVRAGIQNLGVMKVEVTARQIYELNPYAEIDLMPEGLTKENIGKFFEGPPKLDIVIDELDNLAVKYLIREQAKIHKLAVVMAADNGDNGVVDVERYDLDPNLPFFHGRMGEISYEQLTSLDKMGIGRLIVKHIGPETATMRVHESMPEIGRTIVSWPQLGGAALLNGSAVAYCVRRILNGQPLEDNRALISLDEKLIPNYNSPEEAQKRAESTENFKKIFGF